MVRAWHGRGMESVNQTRTHSVDQTGKTHSKPLGTRHGRKKAWARHVICESALNQPNYGNSYDAAPLYNISWKPCHRKIHFLMRSWDEKFNRHIFELIFAKPHLILVFRP